MDDGRAVRLSTLAGAFLLFGAAFGAFVHTVRAEPMLAAVQRPQPAAQVCARGQAIVTADTIGDRLTACLGAAKAVRFLAPLGLVARDAVSISVVDALDAAGGPAVLGLYDPRTRRVQVLAATAPTLGTGEKGGFGVPLDDDMRAGIVAHEVTHAILDQYAAEYPLDRASHEYLAYTVQLATLPPPTRARILAASDVTGFDAVTQASPLYLAIDPGRFAVNAYLHFRAAADPRAVLATLVGKSKAQAGLWE